jgi:hypothetical protein
MTAALDDKRIKKDLQDLMTKLIDACLQISGRSVEGFALRKGTREALASGSANGRASPSSVHRGMIRYPRLKLGSDLFNFS